MLTQPLFGVSPPTELTRPPFSTTTSPFSVTVDTDVSRTYRVAPSLTVRVPSAWDRGAASRTAHRTIAVRTGDARHSSGIARSDVIGLSSLATACRWPLQNTPAGSVLTSRGREARRLGFLPCTDFTASGLLRATVAARGSQHECAAIPEQLVDGFTAAVSEVLTVDDAIGTYENNYGI